MNINRLIYPGFWFGKTKETEAIELAKRGVGGFCIYGGTKQKVTQLVDKLRAVSTQPHLFICADYEDGLGKWMPNTSWVLSNLAVGAGAQTEIAYQKGLTLAREAKQVGVDWIFAPVLDLADEPQNPIVNTRSFGIDPQRVGQLGTALCRGLSDGGVLNSIKHFPGHGQTKQDSHLGLPVLSRSLADLQAHELIPFQTALPAADSVMIGHLLLPALDKQFPASLSYNIITHLLKKHLGFTGLVLTDALCMKAIGDEKQAALQALRAGAHILLAAENSLALSDFLQKQQGLEPVLNVSEQLQNNLTQHLQKSFRTGLDAATFNRTYASQCAVWQGEDISLQPTQEIAYLELGNEEDFAAQTFLHTLEKHHITVKKFTGQPTDILLVASFSNYKAFKGHINLSAAEKTRLMQATQYSKKSIFISFGSPFGTENISSIQARLFCFSPAQEMQICAAHILLGLMHASGKLPVKIIG